ncbi:hypothetical protein DIPPA_01147 [Diplonema papillatum]|nr:hypothetical protein DIPPA_01147 [Diplonema papillatum]
MIANRHCLTDEAADLHERLVMDTGLTVGGVSSHSAKVVLMAADKVAEHIACLYAGAKLIGLTLQFRIDAANTVWLLHCSSVVVSRDRTSHILTIAGARVASLPLRKKQSASQKHHHTRTGYFQGKDFPTLCALCNEHKAKGSCSRVRRGTVLFSLHVLDHFTDAVTAPEVFEEKLLWETGGIPKCIKMLDPRITDEEYAKVKGADWLQGTVVCCYDCLTALIQLTESIKVDKTGDITQPFASKSLPPIAAPPSTQLQALDASSLATSACTVRGGPAAKLSSLQRLPPAACASTSSRVSVRPRTHGTMQQHATAVSSEVLSSHGLSASDTSGAASPPANLVAARRKIRGRIASSR